MEVFLRNVPQDLSEHSLEEELGQLMLDLCIGSWTCDKPWHRKQAWIRFLEQDDAERFLTKHEKMSKQPHPRLTNMHANPGAAFPQARRRNNDVARLYIFDTPVYVERSTRKLDKFTISHLQHKREEKKARESQPPEVEENGLGGGSPTAFRLQSVSCGENMFLGNENVLTFVQHISLGLVPLGGVAKFTQRCLTLTTTSPIGTPSRIEFLNDAIQDIITGHDGTSLTLVLNQPPRIYKSVSNPDSRVKWIRTRHFVQWQELEKYQATSLVYRIELLDSSDFQLIVKQLKSRAKLGITRYHLPMEVAKNIGLQTGLLEQKFKAKLMAALEAVRIPFAILFQVQALFMNNYLQADKASEMVDLLCEHFDGYKQKSALPPVTTDSMKSLFQSIPYMLPGVHPEEVNVVDLVAQVMTREMDLRSEDPLRTKIFGSRIPNHQVWVFRALVTPTRISLHGPEPESRNRVLRKFEAQSDFFLRVTFCEEDGQNLFPSTQVSYEEVFNRYTDVLLGGIEICGRRFLFLGFSHSSLRNHSAWFSAPFIDENYEKQNYATILKSLGNFEDIKIPAKHAARIGQAFSETPYAISLTKTGIVHRYIPDVKSADGSRVFSDGVGTISQEALQEISSHLPRRSGMPSCIQIRWGGVKGILSLDSTLQGKVFCVRKESMMKFPSSDLAEIGICETASKPLRFALNRQVIKILEDMGTNQQWFLDMQNKTLDELRSVTETAQNAARFMKFKGIGTNLGLSQLIKQLHAMGLDYRSDPFLLSAVQHVVLKELRLLKHKARIPVDQGVTLFGVMDETGFLEEGQVYITFDEISGPRRQGTKTTLKDGPVIVTRAPALHPGDVQLPIMVTPPRGHPLRDLQNCIAFSQKGARDLPSQLSGGDLDGDLYNVIWDPAAHPKRWFQPADYPRVSAASLDRPVNRKDIAHFFVDFMKNDILGMVATRHMILADVREEGTCAVDCVKLAGLHSTAVDFSKTGIAVKITELPKCPRYRPDFLAPAPPMKTYDIGQLPHIADAKPDEYDEDDTMGGFKTLYYASDKILGHLYRAIDEKKIWKEDICCDVKSDGSLWDRLLEVVDTRIGPYKLDLNWRRQTEQAWKLRKLYDSVVRDKMWQFNENPRKPLTEVEVFCGFILNKKGSQTRRQRDSSIKLKDEIDRVMAWIVKLIRGSARNGTDAESAAAAGSAGGKSAKNSASDGLEERIELCWACVVVGGSQYVRDAPRYHDTGTLESFQAVAACCLLKELNILARQREGSSGGYVGVNGARARFTG